VNIARLRSDRERLDALAAKSAGVITIESTTGNPPAEYLLTLRCRGLERVTATGPRYRDEHRVRIVLGRDYPLDAPTVEFLTPISHPHVWAVHNKVCLGSWSVAEFLDLLVIRLFRVIQYHEDVLDPTSVANGEAQEWLDEGEIDIPLGNVIPGEARPSSQAPPGITFKPTITFRRTT